MELFADRIQDEKNEELKEMSDKVAKLESLVDELKLGHMRAIRHLEDSHRDEKVVNLTNEQEHAKELQMEINDLKLKQVIR